jgi:hypothetical protein
VTAASSPQCPQCGAREFTVVNPKTGEAACDYCRGTIVHEAFKTRTETEKFLELQRERPVVQQANPNDSAIAEALGRGLMGGLGFHPIWAIRRFFRRLGRAILILALLAAAVFIGWLFHDEITGLLS